MESPLDSFNAAASQAATDAGLDSAAPAPAPAKNVGGRPRKDGLPPGSPEARAADKKAARGVGKGNSPSAGVKRAPAPEPDPEPVAYPEPTEQDIVTARPIAAALLIPVASIDGAAIEEAEVDAMAEPVAATLRYYLGDSPAHPLARVAVVAALVSLPRVVHWYEQRKSQPSDPIRDEVPALGFSSAAGSAALARA